LDIPTRLY